MVVHGKNSIRRYFCLYILRKGAEKDYIASSDQKDKNYFEYLKCKENEVKLVMHLAKIIYDLSPEEVNLNKHDDLNGQDRIMKYIYDNYNVKDYVFKTTTFIE